LISKADRKRRNETPSRLILYRGGRKPGFCSFARRRGEKKENISIRKEGKRKKRRPLPRFTAAIGKKGRKRGPPRNARVAGQFPDRGGGSPVRLARAAIKGKERTRRSWESGGAYAPRKRESPLQPRLSANCAEKVRPARHIFETGRAVDRADQRWEKERGEAKLFLCSEAGFRGKKGGESVPSSGIWGRKRKEGREDLIYFLMSERKGD